MGIRQAARVVFSLSYRKKRSLVACYFDARKDPVHSAKTNLFRVDYF